MRKRTAVITGIWLAAVVLAAAGGAAVLIYAGGRVFGPSVQALSQAQVSRELAAHQAAARISPAPAPPASLATPPGAAAPATQRFTGGTVYASCSAGQVTLTQRIPAQGYQIDSVSPGPAATAWVRFSSGGSAQLVTVTCAAGQPQFTSSTQAVGGDDHGGGGHGGGGRGGSPGGP